MEPGKAGNCWASVAPAPFALAGLVGLGLATACCWLGWLAQLAGWRACRLAGALAGWLVGWLAWPGWPLGRAELVDLAGLGLPGWLGWLDCPAMLILLGWAELAELVELAGLGWPGWLDWLSWLGP